ncbi:MAG TPA: MerR family transcriptional regulator [Bryobacteraceae bacterium]|nr:MerR family transcriptional regulator [Bryobacteraceae bacterium]
MVKIGDFARLASVSIKTLRYYQELGLFHPLHVDGETGYRYYSAAQLPLLNRILIYRSLGFSLERTRALIQENPSPDQLRQALRIRQTELERKMLDERKQLADIEARIRQIENRGAPLYEVVLKEIQSAPIVSIRKTLRDYNELDSLLAELKRALPNRPAVANYGAIWHRCRHDGASIDCEALAVLRRPVHPLRDCVTYQLPGCRVASVVHNSNEDPIPLAHAAVLGKLDATGNEIAGPMREMYWSTNGSAFDVTEIQYPIR